MRFLLPLALSLSFYSATAQPRAYVGAVAGQSNAQGKGNAVTAPTITGNGWAWQASANAKTGNWAVANDPQSPHKIASMKSQTGSLVPALVNALLADSAKVNAVRITHLAMSGTHVLRRATESPSNDWGIGGQNLAALFKQIDLMLAQTNCPDSLDFLVWTQGESDGYRLQLYPTALSEFPDGMAIDTAAHPTTGALMCYTSYPNPSNLPDMYTARRAVFEAIFAKYPGVRLIVNLTADWTGNTGGLTHTRGCRRMRWVDLRIIKDMQAAGYDIRANRLPLTFAARGLVNADGVHYLQPALNELGATDAVLILAP